MLNDRDGRVVVLDRTGALSTIVRPATSVAGGASCVSATLCVLDGITVAYVWDGVNFSEPQQLTDDPFASGIGLSCVRPLFCAAIGLSGAVVGA
jgi:hypothetical protein